jgi:hypothetical protein
LIEPGLTLFQDEDISGLEYPAGGGRRIDILAKDSSGGFVVLELKVEKGYDRPRWPLQIPPPMATQTPPGRTAGL